MSDPIEIKAALDKISDQVKEASEKALAEAAKGVQMSGEQKNRIDELLTKHNELMRKHDELQAELRDLEKKGATQPTGPAHVKSYGEQLVESDEFKTFKARGMQGSMKVSMEVKEINTVAVGAMIRPLYETEPVGLPRRRLTIRNLIPTIPVATSSVDYPKMATRVNNAATVAESAAKPYSDYTWTNATAPVRVLAHLAKLTRQAMDDAPRLTAEVESEMRFGLALLEEAQILNGNNTGQNLNGIIPQATAYVAPITIPSPTSVDLIRLAMLQGALALYPPTGVVLNEADWAFIELTKTTDGAYLFANPQGTVEARMWGLPVLATPAMTIDKFLVGDFSRGATIYDRMGVEVLISTENSDDFEKNLATMRCEERIALAVKRPAAFVYGDFGRVA